MVADVADEVDRGPAFREPPDAAALRSREAVLIPARRDRLQREPRNRLQPQYAVVVHGNDLTEKV